MHRLAQPLHGLPPQDSPGPICSLQFRCRLEAPQRIGRRNQILGDFRRSNSGRSGRRSSALPAELHTSWILELALRATHCYLSGASFSRCSRVSGWSELSAIILNVRSIPRSEAYETLCPGSSGLAGTRLRPRMCSVIAFTIRSSSIEIAARMGMTISHAIKVNVRRLKSRKCRPR